MFQVERKQSSFDRTDSVFAVFFYCKNPNGENLFFSYTKGVYKMKSTTTKKMAIAAVLIAVGVVGSMFSIPVFGSKCSPVQHMINVLAAVILGPWYAVGMAFITSVLRNIFALGSLLAFPGSMCGALLAGLLYHYTKKLPLAYIGEVVGTGIIGGLLSYPIALLLMGNSEAALFTYVVPFLISTVGGTIIAMVLIAALKGTKVLDKAGL